MAKMGSAAIVVAGVLVVAALVVMRRRLSASEVLESSSPALTSGAGGDEEAAMGGGEDADEEAGETDETTALLACVDNIRTGVAGRVGRAVQGGGTALASESVGAVHRVYRGRLDDLVERANAVFLPLTSLPRPDGQTTVTTDGSGRTYFSVVQEEAANEGVRLSTTVTWNDLMSEWGDGVRDLRTALNCAALETAGVQAPQCSGATTRELAGEIVSACTQGTAAPLVDELSEWFEV